MPRRSERRGKAGLHAAQVANGWSGPTKSYKSHNGVLRKEPKAEIRQTRDLRRHAREAKGWSLDV
jgi:hypothetical protein